MNVNKLVAIIAAITIFSLMLAGCAVPARNNSTSTAAAAQGIGSLEVKITDAPNPEVAKVEVTFSGVEIHQAGVPNTAPAATATATATETATATATETATPTETESNDDGGWITLKLDEEATFDLLDYQDGLEKLLATGVEIKAGTYTQVRLDVTKVLVSFKDTTREPEEAKLPGDKLKFIQPFEVKADSTTTLVFDFDAEKSLNFTGNGKIICKPVVKFLSAKTDKSEKMNKPEKSATPTATPTDTPTETVVALEISGELAQGEAGKVYSATLAVTGGKAPYAWSITEGNMPSGLNMDEGVFSGTPTAAGEYTFKVNVVDHSKTEQSITKSYTITIVEAANP